MYHPLNSTRWSALALAILILTTPGTSVFAEELPGLALPRAVENARAWEEVDTEGINRLKYLPIGEDGYLSVGGDFRLRTDAINHSGWRADQGWEGAVFERVMLHGELGQGDHLRLFLQLRSGFVQGPTSPGPVDRDLLDVHQAFGEVRGLELGEFTWRVRAGRLEISEGRLLSLREGPTIRLSHDGLWGEAASQTLRLRAMVLRPVQIGGGVFDDRSSMQQWLWKVVLRAQIWEEGGSRLAVEGLVMEGVQEQARYHRGAGSEARQSLGVRGDLRVATDAGALDADLEGVYQTGVFDSIDIQAHRLSFEGGWRADWHWKPRLFLQLDRASGDQGSGSPVGTYQAYHPRGAYFSEWSSFAPSNLTALSPGLEILPVDGVTLRLDAGRFWRTSVEDGIYSVGMAPTLGPGGDQGGAQEMHIGDLVGLYLGWDLGRYARLNAGAVLFRPGGYLQELGRSATVHYLTGWTSFQF